MIDFARTADTVDTAEILRIGEFHQAIRSGNDQKVAEMLNAHPELCYLKQNGKGAIHIATENLNEKALKLLMKAEEEIPASQNYELRKQGKLPVIFQRLEGERSGEHYEVLSNVTNKTSLEMLLMNFAIDRLDVLEIKDILEKQEERELQDLLVQIQNDSSRSAPYTLEQIRNLGRLDTPYALSALGASNLMGTGDEAKDKTSIAVFLEENDRVANVPTIPSLDDNGKPAGITGVDGVTPLHVAALAGDKVVTQKILDGNTDPRVKNSYGLTAGDMATVMARAHGRAASSEHYKANTGVDPEKNAAHEKKADAHMEAKSQYQEVATTLKSAEKVAEKANPRTEKEYQHDRFHQNREDVRRANKGTGVMDLN